MRTDGYARRIRATREQRRDDGAHAVGTNTGAGEGTGAARPNLWRDMSFSAALAGLIAVLVGFSGSLVIVLSAAAAGHLTQDQTSSWVWAISIGSGLTCLGLSLYTRMPIITAWSTPGAALLVGSLGAYPYREAIGAFVATGVVITVIGVTGVFGRLMRHVPAPVVSAMLAGVLFSFGTGVFTSVRTAPWIAGGVLIAYLVGKRWAPRYAVLLALVVGVGGAAMSSRLHVHVAAFEFAQPQWTTPAFSVPALIGIAVPLTVATLASQNAPGMGVLAASGYAPNDRALIGVTGAVSTVLAPFGSHAINLAAITAAICTGPEAHHDPRRRYVAGVWCGLFYLAVGTLGSTLVALFAGLPPELVAAVAGVALFGALASGLTGAMADDQHREAALITFLATASGVTLWGVGSAFWGLIAGILAHVTLSGGRGRRPTGDPGPAASAARDDDDPDRPPHDPSPSPRSPDARPTP